MWYVFTHVISGEHMIQFTHEIIIKHIIKFIIFCLAYHKNSLDGE